MNPELDDYFENLKQWKEELQLLRDYLNDSPLVEERKWKQACYTHQGKNIAILAELKKHCVLSFFKGSLLLDPSGILCFQGENSRSAKGLQFTNISEIKQHKALIQSFISEAILLEEMGAKVAPLAKEALEYPQELEACFKKSRELETAFKNLTLGRQRAYCMHFASPKKEETRYARIEKYRSRILSGKGMNDCICGRSKKMPSCDGSHKQLKDNG